MKTASTGIKMLDEALAGGLQTGFTILVCGQPGAGMDLFAKQFASGGVGQEDVVYFTTNERNEDIISTMEQFGWKKDINIVNLGSVYYENVLAGELEVSKFRREGIRLRDIKKLKEVRRGGTNLLTILTYEVSKLKPPFRVIIDSLDFFFEYYEPSNVLSAIRTIKAHTQRSESVALLTMLTGIRQRNIESGIEEIMDCIVELERERAKNAFHKQMVIRKYRNHPERTGIYPYELSKSGMAPRHVG